VDCNFLTQKKKNHVWTSTTATIFIPHKNFSGKKQGFDFSTRVLTQKKKEPCLNKYYYYYLYSPQEFFRKKTRLWFFHTGPSLPANLDYEDMVIDTWETISPSSIMSILLV
jgi:hypothetical protein